MPYFPTIHLVGNSVTHQQHDFPWTMYEILETAEKRNEEHIVSWVDDGKGFQIHDREQFIEKYMKTMTKMSKYKSFQRQVNFWGFESRYKARGVKSSGIYYHPDFVRGQRHRLEGLKRVPPARARKRDWNRMFQRLLEYVENKRTSIVPMSYSEDIDLARWVQEQRTLNVRVSKHFTREIQLLQKLPGWTWASEEEADTASVLASLGGQPPRFLNLTTTRKRLLKIASRSGTNNPMKTGISIPSSVQSSAGIELSSKAPTVKNV